MKKKKDIKNIKTGLRVEKMVGQMLEIETRPLSVSKSNPTKTSLDIFPLLKIKSLEANIEEKDIIKDLDLEVYEGEIHAIMGQNGSGKSTLSKILSGHPSYTVTNGTVTFCGKDLLSMSVEERSLNGLFLAFQYPIEVPGLTNFDFLRATYNQKEKFNGKEESGPLEFMELIEKYAAILDVKSEFFERNLNEGFSGGEKKKNEVLQMLMLQPKLVILDEIDSGLDVDALKLICNCIREDLPPSTALIVITHYPKILTYLNPSSVHIMKEGKIIRTGNLEIIEALEQWGYGYFD